MPDEAIVVGERRIGAFCCCPLENGFRMSNMKQPCRIMLKFTNRDE